MKKKKSKKFLKKNQKEVISQANYRLGSTTISGIYEGPVVSARVKINGIDQAKGGTFKDGVFSYYIREKKIKLGDRVSIEGYDSDGNTLSTNKCVTII